MGGKHKRFPHHVPLVAVLPAEEGGPVAGSALPERVRQPGAAVPVLAADLEAAGAGGAPGLEAQMECLKNAIIFFTKKIKGQDWQKGTFVTFIVLFPIYCFFLKKSCSSVFYAKCVFHQQSFVSASITMFPRLCRRKSSPPRFELFVRPGSLSARRVSTKMIKYCRGETKLNYYTRFSLKCSLLAAVDG